MGLHPTTKSLRPLIVLKLGGSVLASVDSLPAAAQEIYRHVRDGARVLAVVSALGDTTDALNAEAHRFSECPDEGARAALLATGERTAAALLALELDRAGVPSTVLDPSRVGPRTEGSLTAGLPLDLDTVTILAALADRPVAILPGFLGHDGRGRATLLGRGGSDLTAIFAGHRLGADRIVLLKDVSGLFECDPSLPGAEPQCYETIGWQEALELGGEILQPRAARYARDHLVPFEVAALACATGTRVGDHWAALVPPPRGPQPLRVLLLGLGTVGRGVYERLIAQPADFEVVGVLVRDTKIGDRDALPDGLLTNDAHELLAREADVVVEAIGGIHPALELCRAVLIAGRSVVTANKALVAECGEELAALAERLGVSFLHSAAVGGAIPALEAAARHAAGSGLRSIQAVLNGTVNFVLDRIVDRGDDLEQAVRAAQLAGFAEADPTLDLDGTDSAQKLILLARVAFGVHLEDSDVQRVGITELDPAVLRRDRANGWIHRLVAACERTAEGLLAWVTPVRLPASHPLAGARREENRVLLTPVSGEPELLAGKGAGRWPTSLAVTADLWDLRRAQLESSTTPARRDLPLAISTPIPAPL